MDQIEHNGEETEREPYEQLCPRHGARIRQYHGCPRCVIEEVRRHETRIDTSLEYEEPVPTDAIQQASAPMAEMR